MNVTVNGDPVAIRDGATIADLLEHLELTRRLVVVEHNGEPVPRKQVAGVQLADGDRLEVVRAVAGG